MHLVTSLEYNLCFMWNSLFVTSIITDLFFNRETEQMYEVRGKEFQCDVSEGLQQISDDIAMYGVKLKQFGVSIEDSLGKIILIIRRKLLSTLHI